MSLIIRKIYLYLLYSINIRKMNYRFALQTLNNVWKVQYQTDVFAHIL